MFLYILSAKTASFLCQNKLESRNVLNFHVADSHLAGTDTTSLTLTWISSNLLNNRRSLQLAQEEQDLKSWQRTLTLKT